MRRLMRQLVMVLLLAGVADASEEDYAQITKMELTAKTTENTFGAVILRAEMVQGQEGVGFSALKVVAKSKTMDVPKDVLAQASRATIMTTTISSEVGFPEKGIGPYLYVCFSGHDGTKPCRFRLVFDSKGFKEMKKEEHPTTARENDAIESALSFLKSKNLSWGISTGVTRTGGVTPNGVHWFRVEFPKDGRGVERFILVNPETGKAEFPLPR